LVALWLIHPEYRVIYFLHKGALFIEQKAQKYFDLAFDKGYGAVAE
jgi:hypothetical protein